MLSSDKGLSPTHFWTIVLGQAVIYLSIWLWDEYVASYITLIFPAMILVILVLGLLADWIEPARVPGWYYKVMVISIIIPVLIGLVFYYINGGRIGWLVQ
jgi:hypothetical protein